MRNLKAGVALALAGSLLLGPLSAAGQNRGFLSGEAKAEAKKPYSDYAVRARNVTTGAIETTAILDPQGNFMLDGLTAGKLVVELTKVGENKVICSEGPFELKADAAGAAFGQNDISIACNKAPVGWLLLAAAAAAGVTAGVVAGDGGTTPQGAPTPSQFNASGAQ
jgi:hypothetical protein